MELDISSSNNNILEMVP